MSHTCHAEGCTLPVPPRMMMCRRHWYMVDKDLRDQVWVYYRPGQEIDKHPSPGYLFVQRCAVLTVAVKEKRLSGEDACTQLKALALRLHHQTQSPEFLTVANILEHGDQPA